MWITFWAQAIATASIRKEHQQRCREWRDLLHTLVAATDPSRGRAENSQITDTLLAVIDGIGTQTSVTTDRGATRRARHLIDAALEQLLPQS